MGGSVSGAAAPASVTGLAQPDRPRGERLGPTDRRRGQPEPGHCDQPEHRGAQPGDPLDGLLDVFPPGGGDLDGQQGGGAVLGQREAVRSRAAGRGFDDGVVSVVTQLLGQDPRLRVVQVVQLLGQDYQPEPGEPGRLEGERVHRQIPGGQFGRGPPVQAA